MDRAQAGRHVLKLRRRCVVLGFPQRVQQMEVMPAFIVKGAVCVQQANTNASQDAVRGSQCPWLQRSRGRTAWWRQLPLAMRMRAEQACRKKLCRRRQAQLQHGLHRQEPIGGASAVWGTAAWHAVPRGGGVVRRGRSRPAQIAQFKATHLTHQSSASHETLRDRVSAPSAPLPSLSLGWARAWLLCLS